MPCHFQSSLGGGSERPVAFTMSFTQSVRAAGSVSGGWFGSSWAPSWSSRYSNESTGAGPPVSLPSGSTPSHSNVKLGPMIVPGAFGPRVMREIGGTVFAEKNRFAGVGSKWPSLSSATIQKTCPATSLIGSTRKRSVVSLPVVAVQVDGLFAVSASSA